MKIRMVICHPLALQSPAEVEEDRTMTVVMAAVTSTEMLLAYRFHHRFLGFCVQQRSLHHSRRRLEKLHVLPASAIPKGPASDFV